MKPSLIAATLILSAFLTGASRAEPVAQVVSVVPRAIGTYMDAAQALEIGSELSQNERIRTDANGAAEIEFVDGTSLTVGANSEVVLDRMLFERDKARNATLNVVRGTLRFVTGNSDHSAYQIKTPVATIGVRGTVIDISVDQGDMVFNTVEGVGVVCHGGTNCRDIRAGEPPVAVNRMGFRIATAAQAARLSRIVTGAHENLSRRIGRDPRMGKGFQKRSDRGFDRKGPDKKGPDAKGFDKKGDLDRKGDRFGDKGKDFRQGKAEKPTFRQRMGERFNKLKGGFKLRRDRDR
jgi:hypothetical protein